MRQKLLYTFDDEEEFDEETKDGGEFSPSYYGEDDSRCWWSNGKADAETLPDAEVKELWMTIFDLIDLDKNGSIDEKEVSILKAKIDSGTDKKLGEARQQRQIGEQERMETRFRGLQPHP